MINVSRDNLVTMNKGDALYIPFVITLKYCNTDEVLEYTLKDNDKLQFRIMNPNCDWDDSLIKKEYTKSDLGAFNRVYISLNPSDTVNLKSGKYFYEVKLIHTVDGYDIVDTIVSRREFILLD